MIKLQKSIYIIFIAILLQTLLGISLGLTALYFSSRSYIASNVYVASMSIGGLHREEAVKKIDDKYRSIVENQSFSIEYEKNRKFEIKYRDIDAALDSEGTVETVFGNSRPDTFVNLFKGYFSSEKRDIIPIVTFNEGKLREKLIELSAFTDKDPINADISINNGKVLKSYEVNGIKLNIDNAVERIRRDIGSSIGGPIAFKEVNGYELQEIVPQYTMYDLDGLDEIISQHSTKIKNLDVQDSIILAASAINRVKLLADKPQKGQKAGTFSFNKYLSLSDALKEKKDEGYNQVVSTLYAAVLNSGIAKEAITRTPHVNTVDYIEPGLDARVLGTTYDFKFENTLEHPIMIFTELHKGELIVSIIGKKKRP